MRQGRSIFRCPICGRALRRRENALCCEAGHSFDIASQGYVHLLPPNRMHAKLPGDSKEMVAARRRFLDTGCYALFQEAAAQIAAQVCAGRKRPVVLDAGCGEGYYTDAVRRALPPEADALVCGFDISKLAVAAAAKRYPQLELSVASCFAIPVADAAADLLLAIFSPIVPGEFARVVRPGGALLLAVAGPRHLFGLKEVLYEHPYENETRETVYPGFVLERRVPVRTTVVIRGQEAIHNLFAMTPYYWKTPADGAKRLGGLESLFTELGFDLLLYRRTEESE